LHTPRKLFQDVFRSPSPPHAPTVTKRPSLLRALLRDSPGEVRRVLESEPEAACEPFWDHEAEPPLCAAVRLTCCPDIVSLLLMYGASVHGEDMYVQTPLMLLHSKKVRHKLDVSQWWADIEQLLLDAGSDSSMLREMSPFPRLGPQVPADWNLLMQPGPKANCLRIM